MDQARRFEEEDRISRLVQSSVLATVRKEGSAVRSVLFSYGHTRWLTLGAGVAYMRRAVPLLENLSLSFKVSCGGKRTRTIAGVCGWRVRVVSLRIRESEARTHR